MLTRLESNIVHTDTKVSKVMNNPNNSRARKIISGFSILAKRSMYQYQYGRILHREPPKIDIYDGILPENKIKSDIADIISASLTNFQKLIHLTIYTEYDINLEFFKKIPSLELLRIETKYGVLCKFGNLFHH